MRRTIKVSSIQTMLFIITFVLVIWAPTTSASTLGSDVLKMITRYSYFMLAILIFLNMILFGKVQITKENLLIAFTVLFYFVLHKIWVYGGTAGSLSSLLLCTLFSFQTDEIKINIFHGIKVVLVIIATLGIICYLSYNFQWALPYRVVDYYATSKHGVWYIDYKISFLYLNSVQTRLCGIFNEPGWFGTFLAFYLCSENLRLNKISNVIVAIAGVMTFSLAFFAILAVYYVLINFSNWRKWIWIVIFLCLYIILTNIHTGNEIIDSFFDRLSVFSNTFWDNARTTKSFGIIYNRVMHSPSIFCGNGSGYSEIMSGGGNLSIKTDIVDFGIVGTTLMYMPLISILINHAKDNKKAVMLLICIAVSLYQRPWLFEVSNFMFAVSCSVAMVSNKEYNFPKMINVTLGRKKYTI